MRYGILLMSIRSNMTPWIGFGLSFSAIGIAFITVAVASDHWNLEEQLPTEVEDTTPSDYGVLEVHSAFRYEQSRGTGHQILLQPRIEYGFAPDWHVKVTAPFLLGTEDKTGSGNLGVELFNKISREYSSVPSFALAVGANFPTGRQSEGIETEVKLVATKALSADPLQHRVHLNVAWDHHPGSTADQRQDRYIAILGYSDIITDSTVLVTDVVREQELAKTKSATILEIGFRHMVAPNTVLSFGPGFGIGRDSPEWRVTVGVQREFD
jgi:hypothetical protein